MPSNLSYLTQHSAQTDNNNYELILCWESVGLFSWHYQYSLFLSIPVHGNAEERNTPSPIDPDAIEVDINFQPDPTDLVLSSVPGGELFNPRKHKFSEEELKPQPMIKKAKKVFVPDEQKVGCACAHHINKGCVSIVQTANSCQSKESLFYYLLFCWMWRTHSLYQYSLWIKQMRKYIFLTVNIRCHPYHINSPSCRMRNTGLGGRRTMWQPSVHVMLDGWRRTRSQCAPLSWSGRTRRCGSRWPSCGRTVAAARTSWPDMRLSTVHCKELQVKPTKHQWDKKPNSLPRRIQHRHKHQGNQNLHCCLRRPPVTVSSSEF